MNGEELVRTVVDVATWSEDDRRSLIEWIVQQARAHPGASELEVVELKREVDAATDDGRFKIRRAVAALSNHYLSDVSWMVVGIDNEGNPSELGFHPGPGGIDRIHQVLTASDALVHPHPTYHFAFAEYDGRQVGVFQVLYSPTEIRVRERSPGRWRSPIRSGTTSREMNDHDRYLRSALGKSPITPELLEHSRELGYFDVEGRQVPDALEVVLPAWFRRTIEEAGSPFYSILPLPLAQPTHAFGGKLYRSVSFPVFDDDRRHLQRLVKGLADRLERQGIVYSVWVTRCPQDYERPQNFLVGVGARNLSVTLDQFRTASFGWLLAAGGALHLVAGKVSERGFSLEHTVYFRYIPTCRQTPLIGPDGVVRLVNLDLAEWSAPAPLGDPEPARHRWDATVSVGPEGPPTLKEPWVASIDVLGYLGKPPVDRTMKTWRARKLTVFRCSPNSSAPAFSKSRVADFTSAIAIGRVHAFNTLDIDDRKPFRLGSLGFESVRMPYSFPQELTTVFYDLSLGLYQ